MCYAVNYFYHRDTEEKGINRKGEDTAVGGSADLRQVSVTKDTNEYKLRLVSNLFKGTI
jgi:hypothetical protein